MRPKIVAGNWKLHGDRASARALLDAVAAAPPAPGVDRPCPIPLRIATESP